MQITFDHNDLANPEALSILRRVIGGEIATTSYLEPSRVDAATGGVVESVVKGFVKTALDGLAEEVVKLRELETPTPAPLPEQAAAPEAVDDSILDSAGVMWDARIHASTRTKVQDGTWKMKRGVEPEIVAQVMAELKGAPAPTKVEAFAAQVDPSTIGFGAVPTAPTTVAAVPVPPVPVPMADTSDWPADLLGPHRAGFEFQSFMSYVMGRVNSGIPTPTLLATCKEHGVDSFAAVNGRPEVIPALARALSQLNKGA